MDSQTRARVRERAGNRSEYCQLDQDDSPLALLHVEHVLPRVHGGTDDLENLALACIDCNLHKGTNLTGVDPVTRLITNLFHPRRERWDEHFAWEANQIVGRSASGRATVRVLQMNSDDRLALRSV